MIALAQLRLSGHVVRRGDEKYTKMARQARIQGKRPKGRPQQTWVEGVQKILKERGTELKGLRAVAPDHERWKALCKPSTPTGRSGSTK
jgi:hypothetical protein